MCDDSAGRIENGTLGETRRVRAVYTKLAGRYDRIIRLWDRVLGLEDDRRWICSRACGDVLEIGIGTGTNLPFYPAGVRITGIDVTPAMLDVAQRRAARLHLSVDLRVGDA
ncbi:MAG: class I SAM-dependent methyltransferase, partial [Actinomycetota bacterium]